MNDARLATIRDQIESMRQQTAQPVAIEEQQQNQPARISPKMPPVNYGEPQRDAVNAVVDQLSRELSLRIADLHKQLDVIEARAEDSSSQAKLKLQDHISICIRLNDELNHMSDVIEELGQRVPK